MYGLIEKSPVVQHCEKMAAQLDGTSEREAAKVYRQVAAEVRAMPQWSDKETKFRDETYDYFTDPANAAHHPQISGELSKLIRLDDGTYVFRKWAEQFKARTMDGIADEATLPMSWSKFWAAEALHEKWIEQNEPQGDGPFVAVMHYGATGEGETVRVISAHATSMPHFILYCGEKLLGYYFVIGTDFFNGIPKDNRLFNKVVPKAMHGFFRPNCNVEIDVQYHVNCS